MKVIFSIVIGSGLIASATAQQQTPPPVTTAPPPAVPNVRPATPQPGVAVGATGRSGVSGTATTGRRVPTNAGVSTPFPVVVPANAFPVYPEPIDPHARRIPAAPSSHGPRPPRWTGRHDPVELALESELVATGALGTGGGLALPPVINTFPATNTLPASNGKAQPKY